jgi:hypothetical protein
MKKFTQIAEQTGFGLFDSPIWRIKVKEYSEAVVKNCVEQIDDLRGYSGVGEDGNPYDTESWNAALTAAKELLIIRYNLEDLKDQ